MKQYFDLLNQYPVTGGPSVSDTVVEQFALLVKTNHKRTAINGSIYSIKPKTEISDHVLIYLEKIEIVEQAITSYIDSRTLWKNNPNDSITKKNLLDSYDNLEDILRKYLVNSSVFRTKGLYSTSLMLFAMYATLIILLLRDGITNGLSWGMSTGENREYKNFFSTCITDYVKHLKYAHDEYCTEIRSKSEFGKSKFDSIVCINSHSFIKTKVSTLCSNYRNVMAESVFDLADSWYSLDNGKFSKQFSGKENVRYLWSSIYGLPVDNSKEISIYKVNGIKNTYYTPSYASLQENFIMENNDQYKPYAGVKINHDSNWIYSIQPIFKDPLNGNRVDGVRKGVQEITESLTKEYQFDDSSVMYGSYDIVPLTVRLSQNSRIDLTRSISYKNSDGSVTHGNDNIIKYCSRVGTNHIPGKVVGNGVNKQVNSKGNVLDCFIIGSISTGVNENNLLYSSKSSIINAQKFSKTSSDVEFKRDHVMPTVHSMYLPGGSSITFTFKNGETLNNKHQFAIRYHFSGSAAQASIDILDSTNKALHSGLQLPKCSKEENFNEYKVKVFTNQLNFTTTNSIKIKSSNNLYINSIILIPN
ncbi:hypothetical protein ACTFIT_000952 [Dictyostelium discoideum]